MLVLLLVLMVFYGLFCVCDEILLYIDGGLPLHITFVAIICASVMRFRD